eukprot:gene1807-2475_t
MPANFMFVSKNPIPGSMDDIDEDDDDENDALIPVPLKAAQGVKALSTACIIKAIESMNALAERTRNSTYPSAMKLKSIYDR